MASAMRGKTLFGSAGALLCMIVLLAPAVQAHEDGLVAIIFTDDSTYGSGDTIKVTVHVLHNGEYVDPDQVPWIIFDLESDDDESYMLVNYTDDLPGREYPTQKQSTGIYRADIPLFDSDTGTDGYASIFIKPIYSDEEFYNDVGMTYGMSGEDDVTFDYFETSEWDGVDVDIKGKVEESHLAITYEIKDISACPWQPGDKIDLTVWVKKDGTNIKPDEISVTDDEDEPIPYNNPSDGVYEISYTIPSTIDENTDIGITIGAMVEGTVKDDVATLEIPLLVVLYQIWCHSLPAPNATTMAFELFVSDGEGRPLSGATVGIEVDYDSGSDEFRSTTDGSGKASFIVSSGDGGSIDIEGWVKHGERNQSFYGSISTGGEATQEWKPDPSGYGFEIEMKPYEGSGPMTFYAFRDGEAMEGVDLQYYMYTDHALLSKGAVKPGEGGMFTIASDVPDKESAEILFVADSGYHPGVFVSVWNDTDEDGFSDKFETHVGSDPDDDMSIPEGYKDTDGDLFGDSYEVSLGTDPNDDEDYPSTYMDSDSDGWGDDFEVENGTDPDSMWDEPGYYLDTDGDDHDDDEEAFYGTSPEDPLDLPFDNYTVNSDEDYVIFNYYMHDEQYDLEEIFYGTDPEDETDYPIGYGQQSDYDGVCDVEEVFYGTDPEDGSDSPNDRPSSWDPRYSDHNSTDGRRYVRTNEYVGTMSLIDLFEFDDDDIQMSIDGFDVGGRNVVEVDSDEPQLFMGIIVLGDIDDLKDLIENGGEGYEQDWQMFEPDPSFPIYNTPDGHKGAFILPSFLPKGSQEYTILAGSESDDLSEISFNHVIVKDGDSTSTKDKDKDKDLSTALIIGGVCMVLLVVAILLMVVIVIVVSSSRKKKAASATVGPEDEAAEEEETAPPEEEGGEGEDVATPSASETEVPAEPQKEAISWDTDKEKEPDADGPKPPEQV